MCTVPLTWERLHWDNPCLGTRITKHISLYIRIFCIGWYDGNLKKTLGMLKLKSSLLYVNCVYVFTNVHECRLYYMFIESMHVHISRCPMSRHRTVSERHHTLLVYEGIQIQNGCLLTFFPATFWEELLASFMYLVAMCSLYRESLLLSISMRGPHDHCATARSRG